jgi:RHS repeat-associated protein
VRWRLRLPGGEYREFDIDGRLLKIGQPSDPRLDVTLAYANGLPSTATDGQGRVLRFEYDGGKMLRRAVLPDGSAVNYGYDTERNLTGVVYPDNRVREYRYAEAGLIGDASQRHHLTGIIAEDGHRYASFKYDARGRAIESRAFGSPDNVTTVSYDSDTQSTVATDTGDTKTYTIQLGLYRRVTAVSSLGQSGQDGQTFDAQGRLTRSTDRLNTFTDYEYDATYGYRSAVIEAVGKPEQRRTEFVRDPTLNRLTEVRVRDAAGTLKSRTQWTYDADGRLTATIQTDPSTNAARTITLAYCTQADVTAGTCPTVGLLKTVDGPLAGSDDKTTYTYRQTDAATCATAPTTCPYRKGDLWKVTNALNQSIEVLASDGSGRVLSAKDANGIVTDLVYDSRGRMVTQKVRGADASTEYDDQITRIEYDPSGTVHRMVLPDGRATAFEYDPLQRLTAVIDNDGNRMAFTLNAAGDVMREDATTASGAVLRTLSRVYDTLGRLQAVTDGELHSTTFGYDAVGNATSERDPLLRDTRHAYDALGRLRATIRNVGGIAAQTQVQYDALDRVVQVTDPGELNTFYRYNGFGDLLELISPDTGTTTSTYDVAGRLATRIDARNITSTYGYDLIDRVTSVAYPDSSRNLGFVYDAPPAECPAGETFHIGRLARMTVGGSDSTAFCYDRFGNLTRKVQTTQGRSFTVRYDHASRVRNGTDAPGRPRPPTPLVFGMTYPDGTQVRIGRNGSGDATDLTVTLANGQTKTLLSGTVHYPFGPAWWWTYGNGRKLTRSRTPSGRPGFVEDSRAGGLSEGYWFDAAGNLDSLRNASQADPPKRKYAYDGLDRLTEVRNGANNALLQGYGYNATGDRTTDTNGATRSFAYATGTHRLSSAGGVNRAYDAAGNTIRIGGTAALVANRPALAADTQIRSWRAQVQARAQTVRAAKRSGKAPAAATTKLAPATVREFAYDDAGRLKQVKRDGVVAMDYRYNAKGERVYRSGSGQTVHTVYDEAGHWLGDYDATGNALQQAIWLDDLPVGLLVGAGTNQKLYYLEPDALGSPRVAIDPDRDVAVWRWDLTGEAFGNTAPNEDPDGDGIALTLDMRFPGQRYDAASELVYNYFRDYDPSTGRYVESDPIGLQGGLDTYGYAAGNSLASSDPLGLAPERNFFAEDDPLHGYVENYFSPPGTFTITGHGDPKGVLLLKVGNEWLKPEEVWSLIKRDFLRGHYKVLRIAHCSAGRETPGGVSVAEAFSQLLPKGARVEATPYLVGFRENGEVFPGEEVVSNVNGGHSRVRAANIPWSVYQGGIQISGPEVNPIPAIEIVVRRRRK